ncbi:hypothetical protein [Streptomyces sp. AC512_CC834]|uniref:hypothetical protein n=1 Tax=Streptomyces sp. AC512_CC834 TaxID=2823691 RepID=UPI001C2680D0|nr:hypothetical protein [Streptomyces sp. AC512_CC834]
MFIQKPNEALVGRLLVSLDRGDLDQWATRLIAEHATLHGTDDVKPRGPRDIVTQYLCPLRDSLNGTTVGLDVTIDDAGATVSLDGDGRGRELFLYVESGRISEMWEYPSGSVPDGVTLARRSATPGAGSCCGD